MYASTTLTRHGLTDTFENSGNFTNRNNSDGYSCHQVHFKIDGHVVNFGSERSMFREVLMHPVVVTNAIKAHEIHHGKGLSDACR
ncbi:hypothetical protein TNCV_3769381 [Trichonephila clavipes]|nr:hypothetical protein TNCV_3769381 [Trichonephila clavipes]